MPQTPRRLDVYLTRPDPMVGPCADNKCRLCVVVSPDEINAGLRTVIIAPMINYGFDYPTRIKTRFNNKNRLILLNQIRAVDKSRLIKPLGKITQHEGQQLMIGFHINIFEMTPHKQQNDNQPLTNLNIAPFSVHSVNIGSTVGSEIKKDRPSVILSPADTNSQSDTVIIAPMTSHWQHYPTRVRTHFRGISGLIALDQIRVIEKGHLTKPLGNITENEAQQTVNILGEMLSY